MEQIRVKVQKANKNHICNFCGSFILKGETYENQTNVFGGDIYDWKSCNHCKDIVERMMDEDNGYKDNGLNDQDFWDYVSDNNIDFKRRVIEK